LAFILKNFAHRRRHIVATNIRLCFSELSETERAAMLDEVFYHNALGLFEAASAYHGDVERFRHRLKVGGQEQLEKMLAEGRGVVLIGAHYSHLDFSGARVSLITKPSAIYRPNNNRLMDAYIKRGRHRFMNRLIPKDDMRGMIRALKSNELVWYPPDQDYGPKHSVYAPFFGVNAASITATSRLVKFNQSPVLILGFYRDDVTGDYHLDFNTAPEGFPSGDEAQDAALINAALEVCIRKAPSQYMWTHRRFKTQPDGSGKLYSEKNNSK
jgi:KDO2-lipid IV(A) lauroyltransferase